MLDVKTNAEIKNLNCRVETHGEDFVPAIDVKMVLLGVPIDRISSLCPEMKRFYEGPQVAIGEVNPLCVGHKIDNLRVKIGETVLNGADLKKGAKIDLQPNHLANVEVTIQSEHHGSAAIEILNLVKSEVMVTINERQLNVVGME